MTELSHGGADFAAARKFVEVLPHGAALGLEVVALGPGLAEVRLPYHPQLIGDPRTGVIHGGAVSTLMDTCSAAAVMSLPQVPSRTATIDLRIDYMRSARPGDAIVARAECYHVTRAVAFIRATAYDSDMTRAVATATGAFTLEPPATAQAGTQAGGAQDVPGGTA